MSVTISVHPDMAENISPKIDAARLDGVGADSVRLKLSDEASVTVFVLEGKAGDYLRNFSEELWRAIVDYENES